MPKFGGVRRPADPGPLFEPVTPGKKFGGVRPQGANRSSGSPGPCPEGCSGEWVEGCWIHLRTCRWASVLWRSHGKTDADWNCPWGCPPLVLPSGWTHLHDCRFWDALGRTPFDHTAPPGVTVEQFPEREP